MASDEVASRDLLIKNVPGDVVRELDARAERNFRSRSGEVLAILVGTCRGGRAEPVQANAEPGTEGES